MKIKKNKDFFLVPVFKDNKYQLSPEEQLAFACMKLEPTEQDIHLMNGLISQVSNWESFVELLSDRGLAPLFYRKITLFTDAELIPDFVKDKLKQFYYFTFVRSTLMYEAYKEMSKTLVEAGILFVPLKGIYLSEKIYKDVGLRQFSDIDILVKPEDSRQIKALLHEIGYTNKSDYFLSPTIMEEVVHFNPLIKEGVSIEIHEKLHSMYEKYNVDPYIFYRHTSKGLFLGQLTLLPAAIDHLIFICTHLDRHFNQGRIQFTGYCDIVNILHDQKNWNWEDFIQQCNEYQCTEVVFKQIMLANKFMHLILPDEIITRFSHVLLLKDEKLLLQYIHGYSGFITGLPKHLGSLKIQSSFRAKLQYVIHALFPPVAFMETKFGVKCKIIVYFYYPYRYWIGVKGVVKLLIGKK